MSADAPTGGERPAAAPTPQLEVPPRPSLAPGVSLKGAMTESAFLDPPWLIDRGGTFIMVPQLLYEIAAHVDGERDLAAIASAASDATKRRIAPEQAGVLVARLMLMGIVAGQDGKVAVPPESLEQARSLIRLNLRLHMLSPRLINPLAGLLRYLYWPPVLLLALTAAAAAEAWLYLFHGIGESFRATVYTPGLMLAVLGIVIVATLFHEFGHAAALRYAGGKVRAMGFGIYLAYPAFYTDVTDNYRLPRWARVRTDLGGFYFNLLFAVGLTVAYAMTGLEFLLIIVVILNIEIAHQLLPMIRLDGYWALADITGIPDFFSHLGPFLRSIVPSWVPLPPGRKLPALKTWGKLFYAGYVAVTIPLLVILLVFTIRAAPRFVATVADASVLLVGQLYEGLRAAQALTSTAIVVQIVLLLLPLIGMSLFFFQLLRRGANVAWAWGTRSPAHGLVTAAAASTAVVLLVVLWVPGILGPGPPPAAGVFSFDPIRKGERLTVGDAVTGHKTVGGDNGSSSGDQEGESEAATPAVDASGQPAGASGPPGASGAPGSSSTPGSAPGSGAPAATQSPATNPAPTATPRPTTAPASAAPTDAPTSGPTATPAPSPAATPVASSPTPSPTPGASTDPSPPLPSAS